MFRSIYPIHSRKRYQGQRRTVSEVDHGAESIVHVKAFYNHANKSLAEFFGGALIIMPNLNPGRKSKMV